MIEPASEEAPDASAPDNVVEVIDTDVFLPQPIGKVKIRGRAYDIVHPLNLSYEAFLAVTRVESNLAALAKSDPTGERQMALLRELLQSLISGLTPEMLEALPLVQIAATLAVVRARVAATLREDEKPDGARPLASRPAAA
jgi:hypothetical protein